MLHCWLISWLGLCLFWQQFHAGGNLKSLGFFQVFSVFAVKKAQWRIPLFTTLPPLSVVQQFGAWVRCCIFICIVYISLKHRDEHNVKWGQWNVGGGVGWDGCRYHAHSLNAQIIQHELLMPWIIARFHGYSPAEYGPLSDSSGEIKTPEKMEKFPLQRFIYFPPTYVSAQKCPCECTSITQ